MTLAIVLFVLAVFSILILFNFFYKPLQKNQQVMDDFEREFLKSAGNYTKVGVNATKRGLFECLKMPLNSGLDGAQDHLFVYDKDENSKRFRLEPGGSNIIIEGSSSYYEIYRFNFNPNIDASIIECLDLSEYDYTIFTNGKIFDSFGLNETALGFPDANIIIKDENMNVLVNTSRKAPKGADVFARTFFIKVFDQEQKKIKNCEVNVQKW